MLPALIGGGLSLLGTFLGNQQRTEGQNKEIELQKEFAQNGLRWKIEDAERAGIHPLAALGATGASYSPVGLGGNDTAAGFSAAGDSIARAVDATRTTGEKAGAYQKTVQDLTLQRMGLENELLGSQIAQIRQGGMRPSFPTGTPIDDAIPASLIESKPMERHGWDGSNREPGAIPDVGWAKTATGYTPIRSQDMTQRLEDDAIGTILWHMRNNVAPQFGFADPPFPPGLDRQNFKWNSFANEWQRIERKSTGGGF